MDTTDSMPSRLLTTHNGNGFAVAGGFLSWLRHPQRGLPYLIFLSLAVLVALTFAIHWTVSNVGGEERPQASLIHGHRSERNSRFGSAKASELKMQIDELRSIRSSVSNELLELEKKRQTLLSEISGYTTAIDGLKQSYQTTSDELNRLKVSFANLQVEQNELLKNNLPNIVAPRQILPQSKARDISAFTITTQRTDCRLHNCFDYSRCSVTSLFPVYVYPFDELGISDNANKFIRESVKQAFDTSVYVTDNPDNACIFVVVVNYVVNNESVIRQLLHQLPYWHGHGLNHVLVNLVRPPSYSLLQNTLHSIDVGAAMVAQSFFTERGFRDHFDLVLPAALGPANGDIWDQLPMLVPARRRYLLSFVGEVNMERSTSSAINNTQLHQFNFYSSYDSIIVNILKKLQTEYISDVFFFEFICKNDKMPSMNNEWVLCGSDIERAELFQQSTFSLIIAPADESLVSTPVLQIWLSELLKSGVVPVILGDYVHLPFSDVVSWSKAVVRLPKARITELHFVLRSFTDSDILEMRQHGRLIYETFLGTTKSIVDTILATIRHRLRIPAFPITDEPSPSVFNESFIPLLETVMESVIEADEMLGPVEPPLASPRYSRNFTFTNDKFLLPGDPFHSYPYTPFEPLMPADAKFVGSSYGFRPIGQGVGGAGKEFSEALGGNVAREQFTVVVLTYEREAVLINAISRLKGLPHINKVVVVWNSPLPPAEDLRWPDIGVKIHVVRTTKNSLNNRFLPYDVIETEAVLSVDDDAHLRHDEIMFGFRVWREARDRIVGFPGRFNSWDVQHQNWLYNSNYSCELSMVLTGAAFIHKYYLYLYSYVMPQAIRDKVDEYINCEDLAMNFLVAHVTRKPPIKVTSRWTFRCPGCPKALSVEESHFNERHKCVNFFVRVYGYMPLLNTQFRADSMLFKTRIPHDKQKCFKFI